MFDIESAGLTCVGEAKDLAMMARDFVLKEVRPTAAEHDISGELNWDAYNKAFEMGLVCADLPEEYGGLGVSNVTAAWIREELMYGDAGFGLSAGSNNLGIKPVLLFGTPEQKEYAVSTLMSDIPGRDKRWPKKRSGFCSFALTEPEAGSDAGACKTTATRVLDDAGNVKEYILNGTKCFITNACYADFMCVVATIDKNLRYKGLTMFLVPITDNTTENGLKPGVTIGKHENKMGIRQSATCDVVFEDMHIPASALIGKEGKGFVYAMKTLEQGRAGVGSGCVGIMRAAIEEAAKYAQIRKTMGKPIWKNQAISSKLADMEIAVQTSRAIGMKVAALLDAAENARKAGDEETAKIAAKQAADLGPVAKAYCSDALQRVVTEAVQILGGYGYMRDYPVEKLMRDARIFPIFEGTNEIQRIVIGRDVIEQYKVEE